MNRFIFSIIGFLVFLFVIVKGADQVTTVGLKHNTTKIFDNLTKINQGKINADLIINGSSKALVHVDPFIVDSVLEINSYNLGLDGTPFIPQYAQYKLYRKNNIKPKFLIQIVSNGTLRSLNAGFKDPIKFSPYLNLPEIRKYMSLTNSFSYLDYHIPMLRYSGKPFEVITGILALFKVQLFQNSNKKGYYPNNKHWPKNASANITTLKKQEDQTSLNDNLIVENFTSLDDISCDLFENFLANCKKENIVVFLVYPPIYSENSNSIKNVAYYKRVAQDYDAYYLDYSRDSILSFNKKYFYNSQHLNVEGATIFTRKLSNDIKTWTNN